jgi:Domain of unknown function (DUF1707)
VIVGSGDEIAAGAAGQDWLRGSHADREQLIDALKDAFVQGRLAKDEFDLRVSKVLATYSELDALTADIPAGIVEAQSSEPARQSHNKKVIQRGTAVGTGVSMTFTATLLMVAKGSPIVGLVVVPLVGFFVAVVLAGLLTLLSWVLERGSSRQPSQGPPSSTDRKASGRLTPAESTGPPRQIRHDPPHAAEAARSRLLRPRLTRFRPPRPWRALSSAL